jgi:hypothetical protein
VADIGIDLGLGDDLLDFALTSAAAETALRLRADTGAGNDSVNVALEQSGPLPCFFEANVLLDLGDGADTANLAVTSSAETVQVNFTVLAGAGNDSVNVALEQVGGPFPCFDVGGLIDLGDGADTANVAVRTTAETINQLLRVWGRGGNDSVTVQIQAPQPCFLPRAEVLVDLGDGHDVGTIVWDIGGPNAVPLQGNILLRLLGQGGNDDLVVALRGALANLQIDALLDGGPGFDRFRAIGPVQVMNGEQPLGN